ncbi:MAG: hypothetical protein MJZ69_07675 [Bacteroidaceae bacterium]|nr:hypothetical protein [Bacteroidaceae bacterium]
MKRKLISLLAIFISICSYAQKDVTTFLGIPVDGTKASMRQKLISKGFIPKKVDDTEHFEGEFNGTKVNIFIATNNNKVYRIMVCDAIPQDETNIRIRFNRLISQFENNKRYLEVENKTIPEKEDISYEMKIHNKNYEAIFYQTPDMGKVDSVAIQTQLREQILEKFTPEQLEDPSMEEEVKKEFQAASTRIGMDLISKKPVWFKISENFGQYYIAIFYDNEYNHANGEDL